MSIHLRISENLLCLSVLGALLGTAASGQEAQRPPERLAYAADRANVPDAIAKVKSGEFVGVHVDMIATAGAVELLFHHDERFDKRIPDLWVLEAEVEMCPRPTDAEIKVVNLLEKSGH